MPTFRAPRAARRGRGLLAAFAAVLLLAVGSLPAASAAEAPSAPVDTAAKPTIVLVHGAFADASGWNAVSRRLQADGYTVIAAANPLRGIEQDEEWLRVFLSTLEGPVVLVGHSYGGAVITNAATGNPNVKALVYIAAYAPDEGETLAEINELGGGHSYVLENLVVRPYPGAPPDDGDGYINPDSFGFVFGADLPERKIVAMAAAQRPAALSALITANGEPAWESIPSWFLIASEDNTVPPEAQRIMAERADSDTREITSSHVAMMTHPRAATRMIVEAATS